MTPGKAARTIRLKDRALSVSGSAEKSFEAGGVIYSHIMDPRSGQPVQGVLSVAVVSASYAICLVILAATGAWQGMGAPYYVGLGVAGVIALYHFALIRQRTREGCFRAFRHNTWFGFAVFAGIVVDFTVRLRAWPEWG